MLLQLVLSQKTEKGTDSYFASQENFTPECMMPWAWVEKIDRTWVRDDCVAATPALGNFSSFLQRIKLFFFKFAFALTEFVNSTKEESISQSYSSQTWLLFGSTWCAFKNVKAWILLTVSEFIDLGYSLGAGIYKSCPGDSNVRPIW